MKQSTIKILQFIIRHWFKFLILGLLVGGVYLLSPAINLKIGDFLSFSKTESVIPHK